MNRLLQDTRYALRQLRRSPGFAAVAVLTLALGIGANTAIFSVVEAVVLRPLPFSEPNRLVWLNGKLPQFDHAAVSPADFKDYRSRNRSFDRLAAMGYRASPVNLSGDKAQQVLSVIASAGFFETLGVQPFLGRDFATADEQVNLPQVAILGYGIWQRNFGGDPQVVGHNIRIDGRDLLVIGVLPRDLPLLSEAQIWQPAPMLNPGMNFRPAHFLKVIGRLKPGVTMPQSQADLDAIAAELARQYPDTNNGWSLRQRRLSEVLIGPVRPALLLIWAAAGLLLLIACVNLANLLLARSVERQREFAIRTALGARPGRMVRQALTESMILALAGGVLGILTAVGGVSVLRPVAPSDLPRLDGIHINAEVLIFTLGISLLTGVVFGLIPAWHISRGGFSRSLKETGRVSASVAHRRISGSLVVGEIAISLALLVGAGLLLKSFWLLIHVNPGFQAEHVVTARISLGGQAYQDAPQRVQFWQKLVDRISNLPGVKAAGGTSELPLSGELGDNPFHIPGRSYSPGEFDDANFREVTPDYLNTMRIPLVQGRWLNEGDTIHTPGVVLVNEAFAKHFFAGQSVLGKRLQLTGDLQTYREIVGVVGDINHEALTGPKHPEMYAAYAQYSPQTMDLVVRAEGNLAALTTALRDTLSSIDKDETLSVIRTMDEVMDTSVAEPRFSLQLLGMFAGLALVLAAIGLYGVMAYAVTQRRNEIGIRMALGAQRGDVLRMIVRQGMKLAFAGVAIGVIMALALARLMASLLYGVKATDLATFLLAAIGLTGVALLANYIPARRAAKVDPMVALRHE